MAGRVRSALTRLVRSVPAADRATLTWDQGKEMAGHVGVTPDTGLPVYF